jgi:hypothetical protein
MGWKRKVTGGALAAIGFMLSPLTWWNDLFVNLPLALAFAWVVSLFHPPAFEVSVVVGYWLTNVLGLVLLHKGAAEVLSKEYQPYKLRPFLRDVGIALLYTGVIVALVEFGFLKPLQGYLR